MALNKLLLLDDVNLLKLLQDNGFEDIAHTLENRDVDGKQFLELSEFQTRCWKLPIAEKRNLFNFIKSVNSDPSILLKKGATTKPITINKPKPIPITKKPTLSLKPQLEKKTSTENIRIVNIIEQNEFKQKLGNILDSPTISNSDFSKLSLTENTKLKEPMPLPPEPKLIATKPVRKDSLSTKSRIMRPLPDEPKAKSFLPQPTSPIKTTKYFKNTDRSPSPEDEYEDVDKIKEIMDYGYLSPNELELPILKPEDDTYEPPPKIKQSLIQKKQFIETKNEDTKISSTMANRAPIPIPSEIDNESDNEMHDYEPIPHHKLKNLRNNMKTIGAYLETETDGEEFLTKPVPDTTSQRNKKYTVQDLEHIIIIDEEQSKRPTKIFGTLSKFFTTKPKQSKSDNYVPGTYENHTLKTEMPIIEVQKIKPFQNRPLPEIPVNNVSPSSSFKRPEKHIIKTKKPEPSIGKRSGLPFSGSDLDLNNKNTNELDIISKVSSRKTSTASGSDISSRKSTNENELEINRLSVDSYIDKISDNEINDLPDYENNNSIRVSRSTSQRNSSSPKPFFSDELAARLAAELKSRGSGFKQKSETTQSSQVLGSNKNFSRIKTPPGTVAGDDVDDEPLYGNVDDGDDENIEEITEEQVVDNIEDDQPVYGNLEEGNENEEVVIDENGEEEEEEEEPEEYIDSIFNINNEKFYRNTDRKGAKLLLRNLQDGAFLFRPSRRNTAYHDQ